LKTAKPALGDEGDIECDRRCLENGTAKHLPDGRSEDDSQCANSIRQGTINPEGMFAMTGAERRPLKLDEARTMLRRVLTEADSDIAKTETNLMDKEQKSHGLSQKLTSLEQTVEKECKAAGLPTPWNRASQESPRRMSTIDMSNANGCAKKLLQSGGIRISSDCGQGAIMGTLHPIRLRLSRDY